MIDTKEHMVTKMRKNVQQKRLVNRVIHLYTSSLNEKANPLNSYPTVKGCCLKSKGNITLSLIINGSGVAWKECGWLIMTYFPLHCYTLHHYSHIPSVYHIDSLLQDCSISSAFLQSCIKPSTCSSNKEYSAVKTISSISSKQHLIHPVNIFQHTHQMYK